MQNNKEEKKGNSRGNRHTVRRLAVESYKLQKCPGKFEDFLKSFRETRQKVIKKKNNQKRPAKIRGRYCLNYEPKAGESWMWFLSKETIKETIYKQRKKENNRRLYLKKKEEKMKKKMEEMRNEKKKKIEKAKRLKRYLAWVKNTNQKRREQHEKDLEKFTAFVKKKIEESEYFQQFHKYRRGFSKNAFFCKSPAHWRNILENEKPQLRLICHIDKEAAKENKKIREHQEFCACVNQIMGCEVFRYDEEMFDKDCRLPKKRKSGPRKCKYNFPSIRCTCEYCNNANAPREKKLQSPYYRLTDDPFVHRAITETLKLRRIKRTRRLKQSLTSIAIDRGVIDRFIPFWLPIRSTNVVQYGG